jgi:hypothetical protein
MLDPTVINGMIAKHILEYFGTGYNRPGISRQPIPGVDATYTRVFELFIPLCAHGWNPWPDHYDYWLGWMDQSILEIFVEDTAQPFGLSGVTITSVAISAAISNSFVSWNWIRETTYRTPRSRRNLTSGRDLEGELIHRGSIFILRRSGRLRHRSSSTTTASPPSPSIPSTSHIHLVVIPVLVVDLYKYYSSMIGSIIIAMMLIASMSE